MWSIILKTIETSKAKKARSALGIVGCNKDAVMQFLGGSTPTSLGTRQYPITDRMDN